jgi:hypothetical protein
VLFSQLMVVDGPAGNGPRVLAVLQVHLYRTLMTRGREDAYGEAGRRVGVAILSRGGSCHSKVIGEEAHTTIRAHLLRGEPHRARRRRPAVRLVEKAVPGHALVSKDTAACRVATFVSLAFTCCSLPSTFERW